MQANLSGITLRQFIPRFLRIWMVLTLVLVAILWLFYRTEINANLTIIQAREQHALQVARQAIGSEMSMLQGDVVYLAQQTSLQSWLETGDAGAKASLASDLLAFARHRMLYDQVRFLDDQGQEVVRINWNNGKPFIVADDKLQNKSSRYYIQNSLALAKGDVFVSPFDLNIEQKVIEQPIKPVIRVGTPVFDSQGRKRGVMVLNYLGKRLLDRMRDIPRVDGNGSLWLLNSEGYWLLGDDPDMEWAFMYADRKDHQFGQQYPDVWKLMQEDRQHQFMHQQGLFTYAWIDARVAAENEDSPRWLLVVHTPSSMLSAMANEQGRWLVVYLLLLVLLLAVVSGALAYYGVLRHQSDVKIRESENRFRRLLESAPDAILIVDQSGQINLVNNQVEKWFGYTREELVGQSVEVLVPQRFRGEHVGHREGYIVHPTARPMASKTELYGVRKDGSEFPVEISLSPLETSQGLLITSIIRDISLRKQAEHARLMAQVRYQELVNNLPVGVYRNTLGPEGRFLEVNQAIVKMFEADSMEQMLAHAVSDLYCDPRERKLFSDKIQQQGQVSGEVLHLKTLRGREFYAAITAALKKDNEGNAYADGIVEDISERMENERQIQQLNHSLRSRSNELQAINQELEAFCYSVSHDLRAPLRAIDGFSRTLLNDYSRHLDEKGNDRLNRVRAAAQRMAALIDDLLKLSRVSRAEIKQEAVDLSQIATDVMDELRQGDPQRQVSFSVQPELHAQGDPQLLRVVMDNLLGNAWKFTRLRTDARIDISGRVNGRDIVFAVRDNGAGFDMAYIDKLFGAFQRLHDANEFPGTGIGLATVQRVINKHGGRIWAESVVGQGATFYFSLQTTGELA